MLLPLDGSELAESALPYACALAESATAKIILLRVVSPAEFRSDDAFSRVDWRLRQQQADAYLQNIAKRLTVRKIDHKFLVLEGSPADVILEAARQYDAQLLVMCTHGHGAATNFPQGGVAAKVLSTYDGSVMLVGGPSAAESETELTYRHIVVPVDGSHETECALRIATILAQTQGARLSVVCICEAPAIPSILNNNERARQLYLELSEISLQAADRKLASLRAQLPEELEVSTAVHLAQPSTDPLMAIANEYAPDLLVTSRSSGDGTRFASSHLPAAPITALVPALLLNTKKIASGYSQSCRPHLPGVRAADVS